MSSVPGSAVTSFITNYKTVKNKNTPQLPWMQLVGELVRGKNYLSAQHNVFSFTKLASFLIRTGVDVNSTNELGYTALMRAAKGGHTKCLKMLVDSGADVNVANFNGSTACVLLPGIFTRAVWIYLWRQVPVLVRRKGGVKH